ncbi:hypothetical protein ACFSHO_17530 [Acinetobacter vivianii]
MSQLEQHMSKQQPTFELRDEDELSLELIEAQYALKESRDKKNAKSVLVLVSGIELAGKGEAVKQLREWLDPRYLRVKADAPQFLTNNQPFWQSYTRFIPAEGQIVVMFGNWYSDLLTTAMHVSKPLDENLFDAYIEQMRAFEHDLQIIMYILSKSGLIYRGNRYKNAWTKSMLRNSAGINYTVWIGGIKNNTIPCRA